MKLVPDSVVNAAKKIKYLFLDVDGVLTDGKLYFSDRGEELKAFNIKDGLGIKLLKINNIGAGIITARQTESVNHRARELKLDPVFQGSEDKAETLKKFLKAKSISLREVAYLGDDLPDLQVIKMVGLGVCVANSPSILIESADWQVKSNGGEGAVRELAELILQSQNKLNSSIEKYL